ncbi:methionine ABC transporter permease [Scatolibacter rhodanostii]|uniref:methionine ABC transporter permease n=1 Tax=Scatolibacter rhodanostii TaxID=2014781 RepID=UPI000C081A6D|nr:methionine ABC transporter permease [Scatolibacter rhodanostii]
MWDNPMTKVLLIGIWESFYMTILSTIFAYIFGTPLGIILVMSGKDGIRPQPVLFKILDIIVNITRSIPFLILMISVTPLTRLIMGTQLGSKATIVPLVLAATPFVARMVESSLLEIDRGIIEAAHSMGASNFEIIFKVMLPEAVPSLINGATIAVTTILGYSASAGVMGGGGLGTIAINYGYNRNQGDIMLITIILLIILVQIFQEIGMRIAGVSDKRKS